LGTKILRVIAQQAHLKLGGKDTFLYVYPEGVLLEELAAERIATAPRQVTSSESLRSEMKHSFGRGIM